MFVDTSAIGRQRVPTGPASSFVVVVGDLFQSINQVVELGVQVADVDRECVDRLLGRCEGSRATAAARHAAAVRLPCDRALTVPLAS